MTDLDMVVCELEHENKLMRARNEHLRKAMELALEVLEECRRDPRLKYEHLAYDKTITAIKKALAQLEQAPYIAVSNYRINVDPYTGNVSIGTVAQPEQEPVAEYIGEGLVELYEDLKKGVKLYPAPQAQPPQRPWIGLTDDDAQWLYDSRRRTYD